MGSCMSCKAGKEAYAYTTTPAFHACPHYKSIGNGGFMACKKNETKPLVKRNIPYTRGQATLFGFKRRPATAPSSTTAPILDNATAPAAASVTHLLNNRASCDEPHEDIRDLSPISSSKSTPRIPRPKKDVDGNNTVRTNRFGFRSSTPLAITNKVGDCNFNVLPPSSHVLSHQHVENQNITGADKPRAKGGGRLSLSKTRESGIPAPESAIDTPKNKNKSVSAKPEVNNDAIQATRFTLQTTHLPKLQYPVRLSSVDVDVRNTSKIAKTAANNSTRRGAQGFAEESSSKEGSEDSGIGSHQSTGVGNGETDTLHGVEILDSSPTYGCRRNRNMQKPRTLEMVVSGQSFDLRDLKDEDASDPNVITEISVIPLQSSTPRTNRSVPTTGITRGIVQERSRMYRQQVTGNSPNNVRQGSRMGHPVFDSNNPLRIDEDSSSDRSSISGRAPRVDSEEKVYRDSSNSEKSLLGKGLITPSTMEGEDWGHGEAMAEEISSSSDDGGHHLSFSLSSTTSLKTNIPVTAPSVEPNQRPVILRIEDPRFAAFAAAASSNMIEDEKSPVDSLISSPPSSSADDISEGEQQKSLVGDDGKKASSGSACEDGNGQRSGNTLSPESPGTPTNASNSLSLSEGRDFLIDDEIADQPGLTFDDGAGTVSRDLVTSSGGCSSLHLSENITLVDSPPKSAGLGPAATTDSSPSPARSNRINRTGSVDTLSPCESIASDDLMLDYERSEKSEFDGTGDSHFDGSMPGGLHTLDESSADASDDPVKEWSVTASSLIKEAGLVTGRSRLLRPRAGSGTGTGAGGGGSGGGAGGGGGGSAGSGSSAPDSPRSSLDSRPRSSPLRPHQQRSQTNSSDCDDGGLYLDRHTYHSICQDIVNHKTMLLKLMRHLQKDQENRAETLNPFDSSLKNGLFYNLASTDVPAGETEDGRTSSIVEEVADLRRQVVFLQQQLEEKERTIQLLQIQMVKYSGADGNKAAESKETCNAATQTDRVRPVSAGPSLLQSLPSDNNGRPLVSSNDPWSHQRQSIGGSNPALAKPPSRLPSARLWKPRSNPAQAEPHGEPHHTTSRRPHSLALGNSGLPQKLVSSAAATGSTTAGSLPHQVNSVDKRTLIAK